MTEPQKPTPNLTAPPRARLGWWHAMWRAALLLGHHLPETPVVPGGVSGPVRELALLLEEHRSQFAAAARTLGADYKGGYWMMYLIAPLAVFCSAAAGARLANVRWLTGIELVLIGLILILFLVMRRGDWQERWIRARRTSEHLRYLPLVAPFVRNQSANWYEELATRRGLRIIVDEEVTRVCRWLGHTNAAHALRLEDPAFYSAYLHYVQELLAQQIRYHTAKAEVEHTLSRRIGLTSTSFFVITIVCTALLFLENLAGFTRLSQVLRLFATVLPAIGGGLRGLLAQGESHRVAALSEGMAVRLAQLRDQLTALIARGASTDELESLVLNVVQELLSEADTWMRLQESAPLSVAA